MGELIRTSAAIIGGEEQQTVNARELWKFLESKQDFSDWLKNRIKKYGFADGVDFTVHKIMDGSNHGRFSAIDYLISLDMAKELAMVENNERGKQARRYFIEVEREYRKQYKASGNLLPGPETALAIQHVAKILLPVLEARARDRVEIEFFRNFRPKGKPGDLNKNGEHKTQFRRGYFTAGKGRSITALIEHMEHPGLFEEVHLNAFPTVPEG